MSYKTIVKNCPKTCKGFTLIELMIVVSIIGILSTVALPSYQEYIRKARMTEGYVLINSMTKAQIANFYDWGHFGGIDSVNDGQQFYIPASGKSEVSILYGDTSAVQSEYIGYLSSVIPPGMKSYFTLKSANGFFDSSGTHRIWTVDAGGDSVINGAYRTERILFKSVINGATNILQVEITAINMIQSLPGEHYAFSSATASAGSNKVINLFQLVRAYDDAVSVSPVISFPVEAGTTVIGK